MTKYVNPIRVNEAKWKIIDIDFKKEGSQSSYNIDTDLFKILEEKNVICYNEYVDDYPTNDSRPLDDKYVLSDNYEFKLGPEILNLIGENYKDNNKFIISKTKSEAESGTTIKYQLMNNVYSTLGKNHDGYDWFVELFKKNIYGNDLKFDIDERKSLLTIDTIFYPKKGFSHLIEFNSSETLSEIDKLSYNRIVFGAPGTGKSHRLNEDKEIFDERYERVTFHPNYSYSQFVGTYKPQPEFENRKPTKKITYDYVPGPFMRVYTQAHKHPDENYLLLIEEINRANVTAVFGDVFQLLDRKNGESEFEIETSEDIRKYFNKEMKEEIDSGNFDCKRMKIPKNMYIWATMNSADQGVFPMDTAFKRRWDFEYIGIDYGVDDNYRRYHAKFPCHEEPINWNDLRMGINEKLSKCYVNEDKLLGPYFISKDILDKMNAEQYDINNEFMKAFKSKVLMYLFEDAGKHCDGLFEGFDGKPTFSKILDKFEKEGLKIFGENFPDEL